jgi:hypothetical protein
VVLVLVVVGAARQDRLVQDLMVVLVAQVGIMVQAAVVVEVVLVASPFVQELLAALAVLASKASSSLHILPQSVAIQDTSSGNI